MGLNFENLCRRNTGDSVPLILARYARAINTAAVKGVNGTSSDLLDRDCCIPMWSCAIFVEICPVTEETAKIVRGNALHG
jgi:hypothetical protein